MNEKKDEFLEKSLDRINHWLQFAETKHGALIAFLIAILAIVCGGDFINNLVLQTIVAIVYLVALIISLLSFYPRYDKDTSRATGKYNDDDNLLFWKDIAKYSEEDFLKKIYKDFFSEDEDSFRKSEKLYAQEIITNARITSKKYDLFRIAVIIAAFGMMLLGIILVVIT